MGAVLVDFISTTTFEKLSGAFSDLKKSMISGVIDDFFLEELNCVTASDFGHKYSDIPPNIVNYISKVNPENSTKAKYLILLFFALKFDKEKTLYKVPDSFSNLYDRYFNSLCMRSQILDPVICRGDTFEKDLSICLGKSILAGSRILCEDCFSRSLLIKAGYKQCFEISKLLLKSKFQNHGFEMHTHLGYLEEFNSSGWRNTLIRCQDFLEKNIGYDFIFVCSWIYDPKLFTISPNLKYHVDDGVKFGAIHARWGKVGPDCGALSKSKKRKKLYDEGVYKPEAYCLIWHKSKLKTQNF